METEGFFLQTSHTPQLKGLKGVARREGEAVGCLHGAGFFRKLRVYLVWACFDEKEQITLSLPHTFNANPPHSLSALGAYKTQRLKRSGSRESVSHCQQDERGKTNVILFKPYVAPYPACIEVFGRTGTVCVQTTVHVRTVLLTFDIQRLSLAPKNVPGSQYATSLIPAN